MWPCFSQIPARYTSTASNIRNLPITPGLLYITVSRLAECGTTKEDITEAAARLQGARARLLGTTATSWPGLLYR